MNPNELFARERKAQHIVAALRKADVKVEDVRAADLADSAIEIKHRAHWIYAAQMASKMIGKEVLVPHSQTTVDLILLLLSREPEPEPKSAQQEADEAAAADEKAEAKWEDSQEYGGNRCPVRE